MTCQHATHKVAAVHLLLGVQADRLHVYPYQATMLAEHECHAHYLTGSYCVAAEDIADLGVRHSIGLQAVVGETEVHLWQKGDALLASVEAALL